MGGHYPVRVQSMTSTNTLDVDATVNQAKRMIDAGCEYVRITVPGRKEIDSLREIHRRLRNQGILTPLIADIHFKPEIAEMAAAFVEKVRINPGNYIDKRTVSRNKTQELKNPTGKSESQNFGNDSGELERIAERLEPLLKICKDHGTAIRIGVNHGSLSTRILEKYGDTPKGMVESALEFARICEYFSFGNLVLSMKASNVKVMIAANRLLVEEMKKSGMNYPIHLGVTEAGAGEDGRIKSAVGIGSLLADGIGDTIRVSLTEDPELEIPVAFNILQAADSRITKTEFISCPSCGRTRFDIQQTLTIIQQKTSHLPGLKIAVMGCVVNGPGEMADADYGYIGAGKGKVNLYKRQVQILKDINEESAVDALIKLIKESGDWLEPPVKP